MTSDLTEADALIERLRNGDQHVLADLFALYRGPLARMIDLRLDPRLGGRVSASDVIQEAYLDAAKRVNHFLAKPGMPFFVWLRLIAGQRLIDVHRQHLGAKMRAAGQEISINRDGSPGASSVCLAQHLIGSMTSPSEAAQRVEVAARLEEALNSLDPIDREVLSLRHFEELSNRERPRFWELKPRRQQALPPGVGAAQGRARDIAGNVRYGVNMGEIDAQQELIDRLVEEFSQRCRRGEQPSIRDYAQKHPEVADQLREVLPPVALIEQLKRGRPAAPLGEDNKKLEHLGDYHIIREVGRGGMGIVYEAQQQSLGRRVALKILPRHSFLDKKPLERFRVEAKAARSVAPYEHRSRLRSVESDGLHYYAMPVIQGRGLDRVLDELKRGHAARDTRTRPPRRPRLRLRAGTAS